MAKKPAPKKKASVAPAKSAPKKVVKPAPKAKAVVKVKAKVVAKAKPIVKKAAPKPVAKKAVAKKPIAKVKPVVKKTAVKPAAKKAAPKPIVKKAIVKPIAKKTVNKPEPTKVAKPIAKEVKAAKPQKIEKSKPVLSKKDAKLNKQKEALMLKRQNEAPIPELKLPIMRKVGPQPIKRSTVDLSRTRYPDSELEEFRVLITDKMTKSKEELHYIQEQITKSSENSTADTENRFGGMEDGAGTLEREYLNQMATRLGTFISHMEKALMRIDNKTYGICRVTGKLISKERLRAVPHATLSLEAKEMERR
jgi:RNA polymerase-binding transcription factor DksA